MFGVPVIVSGTSLILFLKKLIAIAILHVFGLFFMNPEITPSCRFTFLNLAFDCSVLYIRMLYMPQKFPHKSHQNE